MSGCGNCGECSGCKRTVITKQGERGPIGATGLQGIQGIQGANGADGANGIDGQGIDHTAFVVSTGSPDNVPNQPGQIDSYGVYGDSGETIVLGSFDVYNGNNGGIIEWIEVIAAGGISQSVASNYGYISDNSHPANATEFLLGNNGPVAIGDKTEFIVRDGVMNIGAVVPYQIGYQTQSGNITSNPGTLLPNINRFSFAQYEKVTAIYMGGNIYHLEVSTQDLDYFVDPVDRIV